MSTPITDANIRGYVKTYLTDPTKLPPGLQDISLWDVCHIDMKHYQISEDYAVERENRHCHMNQENNAILARKIKDWINGKEFVLDPADFTTPSENVDYYFLRN
jgi:hypothetical protein